MSTSEAGRLHNFLTVGIGLVKAIFSATVPENRAGLREPDLPAK